MSGHDRSVGTGAAGLDGGPDPRATPQQSTLSDQGVAAVLSYSARLQVELVSHSGELGAAVVPCRRTWQSTSMMLSSPAARRYLGSMLSHVSLGVVDLERARRFYDAALAPLGAVCLYGDERCLGYGPQNGDEQLNLFRCDRSPEVGPGFHLAFEAPSRGAVEAFHAAALAFGGRDDGPPGVRVHYGESYFAAFVFDPDGHKLEAVCQG